MAGEAMAVEYGEQGRDHVDGPDSDRVVFVGAQEEPRQPERVLAIYHIDCFKTVERERNEANEWRP